MPKIPLTETGMKWGMVTIPVVFALVWLYNAYKLGRLNINWYKNMPAQQRKRRIIAAAVCMAGILLTILFLLILRFF